MSPAASVCANHPERPGRALCMDCRKVVCGECATEWDGVNYCAACLVRRRARQRDHRRGPGVIALVLASALLLVAAARLSVWAGVFAASLR